MNIPKNPMAYQSENNAIVLRMIPIAIFAPGSNLQLNLKYSNASSIQKYYYHNNPPFNK